MAQQNSPLTRTNMDSVTSVSPLEHESSPKNDNSLAQKKLNRNLRLLQRLREIHNIPRKEPKQRNFNPLNYVCTESGCKELNHA
ncbi:hypothetical protein [Vibrio harveyi]|uniref:hypothetical protein n=1 Tax=Vibrio harveyi TaxID=669 RepID=UPI003BB74E5E